MNPPFKCPVCGWLVHCSANAAQISTVHRLGDSLPRGVFGVIHLLARVAMKTFFRTLAILCGLFGAFDLLAAATAYMRDPTVIPGLWLVTAVTSLL